MICQDHAVSPSLAPHSPQPHCCALSIRPACTQIYTGFPEAWLHEPASLAKLGMVTACSSICLPGVQAWHCQAYVPLACSRARDCQRKVPVPHLLNLTSKSMLCLLHCCGGRHQRQISVSWRQERRNREHALSAAVLWLPAQGGQSLTRGPAFLRGKWPSQPCTPLCRPPLPW